MSTCNPLSETKRATTSLEAAKKQTVYLQENSNASELAAKLIQKYIEWLLSPETVGMTILEGGMNRFSV